MIEIITSDGVLLDLDPDCEFEIEMEQPLLSDDRIPAPCSTVIGFPLTLTNCTVFGYIPDMMIEPSNTTVPATVVIDGIPFMTGTLELDSIENGILNYSFVEKGADSGWGKDISALGYDFSSILASETAFQTFREDARKNGAGVISTPLLMVKDSYDGPIRYDGSDEAIDKVGSLNMPKVLHNYTDSCPLTPVFDVAKILELGFGGMISMNDVPERMKELAVIAQYKPDGELTWANLSGGTVKLQNSLPEITFRDFFLELLKMADVAVFRDGSKWTLKSFGEFFRDEPPVDWSDKVSDKYSMTPEKAQGYEVGYANSSTGNETWEGTPTEYDSFSAMVAAIDDSAEGATGVAICGDVYSYKRISASEIAFDVLLAHSNLTYKGAHTGEETYSRKVDLNLVRTVPVSLPGWMVYRMCPVLDFPATGDSRGKDVYIGVLAKSSDIDVDHPMSWQLTGNGFVTYKGESTDDLAEYDIVTGVSPANICSGYREDWLAKDKMTISVDLRLSLPDLLSFRLWNVVKFSGRKWVTKKLTVSLSVSSGRFEVSGEFLTL